jgi:hypothetical protein
MSAWHQNGPWAIDQIDTAECHILGPANGFCANIIATVHSTDLDEGAANARLIVAAPETLNALRTVYQAMPEVLEQHGLLGVVTGALVNASVA